MHGTTEIKKMSISIKWLLSIYIIVPILILFVLVDVFIFDRLVEPFFSSALLASLVFLWIFEGPHVFASFFSYFDKEYLSFYKDEFFGKLPYVLLTGLIIAYYDVTLAAIAILIYTVYHVISQAGGISAMIARLKFPFYNVWRISAVGSFSILYLDAVKYITLTEFYFLLWAFLTAIFLATSIYINSKIDKGIGKQYFIATAVSVISSGFFFFAGYVFFAIFVLRFVHDITAFVFYIVHDRNRNIGSPKNWVYKILSPLKIPLIFLIPILALIVAYLLRFEWKIYDGIIYTGIIITFTHYYIESFMWKNGSIHRNQLSFTK